MIQPHALHKNSQHFNCASFAYIDVFHWFHCSLHSFLEKKTNLIIVIKRKEHVLRRPYRTRARARVMGEVEEVQEQIKADMEEKMATMVEAMMSMKKIMEANTVAVAATSAVAKVNPMPPSDLNQMNHPTSDMVGKDLGSTSDMCKFKTSTPSRHMVCLRTILHPTRMSISPLIYSLRANNLKLIMHMSLNPWGRHMKYPIAI